MENYKRVASSRTSAPQSIKENEIRITAQGLSGSYISYALSLFQDKHVSEVVLTAMGRVISKAVLIAEILKKRIRGLHQNISLASSDVKDIWEPLEEGLNTLEMVRHVSMISITLSTKELDTSSCGYQPPISSEQDHPLSDLNCEAGSHNRGAGAYFRGKGLQRRNMRLGNGDYCDGDENWNPGKVDYGARGRGYSGRGYIRGHAQGAVRSFSRGFITSYPEANARGYNKGNPQADSGGYGNGYSQVNNREQNYYHSQTGIRRHNSGYMQNSMRGYNGQRGSRQYIDGPPQSSSGSAPNNEQRALRGQGGSGGRGRGRGRYVR